MMGWYKTALRKHFLRFDPRVMVDRAVGGADADAMLTTFITSSIIKGLDIIGVVSQDVALSHRASYLARQQGLDIFVLPGQQYLTSDGYYMVVYKNPTNVPSGLEIRHVVQLSKSKGFLTLVYDIGKQQANNLLQMSEDGLAPSFVEIFSGKTYGYTYFDTDTYEVVSSGAESAFDLEKTNIYTRAPRKDMEHMGVIPHGQGADYTPPYLQEEYQ